MASRVIHDRHIAVTAPLAVALDATALLDAPTGIGVFTREVLAGLATDPTVDARAFAVSWRGRDGLAAVVPSEVRVARRPFPARAARAAWLRGDHPTVGALLGPLAEGLDVVHGPNFVVPPGDGAAEVVTVHDLTAIRFPELCTPAVLQWPELVRRAIDRGAWVHTVSEFVADEVRGAFAIDPRRVVTVPNGVTPSEPATPGTDAALGRHLAGAERYLLAVGTVEPRKDLPGLVAAFDLLADADPELRLVIAGPDGWGAADLTRAVDGLRHRRRVVRLGWVDDRRRLALLRGASVVAYPSRYEGFGLVPLEAMAVGVPVVATAAGALPEVLGDAALLVPTGEPEALAAALAEVLHDDAVRHRLVSAGHDRVAAHPWSATVAGLVGLYRRAAEAR